MEIIIEYQLVHCFQQTHLANLAKKAKPPGLASCSQWIQSDATSKFVQAVAHVFFVKGLVAF